MKHVLFFLTCLYCFESNAQEKFNIYTEFNLSNMEFYSFLLPAAPHETKRIEILNLIGKEMKIGFEYIPSWWQVGSKISLFSYNNVKLTDMESILYTDDWDVIISYNPYKQHHISASYLVPAIYIGVNKTFFNRLKVKLNYGTVGVFGHEHQMRATSEGGGSGFKIASTYAYKRSADPTWLGYVAVSAQTKLYKSLHAGLNYSYHDIGYHSYGLHLSVNL